MENDNEYIGDFSPSDDTREDTPEEIDRIALEILKKYEYAFRELAK